MSINCIQNNIPQVDNSEMECEVFIKETCIKATRRRLDPINVEEGESYADVLDKLLYKIRELETRINILEL